MEKMDSVWRMEKMEDIKVIKQTENVEKTTAVGSDNTPTPPFQVERLEGSLW